MRDIIKIVGVLFRLVDEIREALSSDGDLEQIREELKKIADRKTDYVSDMRKLFEEAEKKKEGKT